MLDWQDLSIAGFTDGTYVQLSVLGDNVERAAAPPALDNRSLEENSSEYTYSYSASGEGVEIEKRLQRFAAEEPRTDVPSPEQNQNEQVFTDYIIGRRGADHPLSSVERQTDPTTTTTTTTTPITAIPTIITIITTITTTTIATIITSATTPTTSASTNTRAAASATFIVLLLLRVSLQLRLPLVL